MIEPQSRSPLEEKLKVVREKLSPEAVRLQRSHEVSALLAETLEEFYDIYFTKPEVVVQESQLLLLEILDACRGVKSARVLAKHLRHHTETMPSSTAGPLQKVRERISHVGPELLLQRSFKELLRQLRQPSESPEQLPFSSNHDLAEKYIDRQAKRLSPTFRPLIDEMIDGPLTEGDELSPEGSNVSSGLREQVEGISLETQQPFILEMIVGQPALKEVKDALVGQEQLLKTQELTPENIAAALDNFPAELKMLVPAGTLLERFLKAPQKLRTVTQSQQKQLWQQLQDVTKPPQSEELLLNYAVTQKLLPPTYQELVKRQLPFLRLQHVLVILEQKTAEHNWSRSQALQVRAAVINQLKEEIQGEDDTVSSVVLADIVRGKLSSDQVATYAALQWLAAPEIKLELEGITNEADKLAVLQKLAFLAGLMVSPVLMTAGLLRSVVEHIPLINRISALIPVGNMGGGASLNMGNPFEGSPLGKKRRLFTYSFQADTIKPYFRTSSSATFDTQTSQWLPDTKVVMLDELHSSHTAPVTADTGSITGNSLKEVAGFHPIALPYGMELQGGSAGYHDRRSDGSIGVALGNRDELLADGATISELQPGVERVTEQLQKQKTKQIKDKEKEWKFYRSSKTNKELYPMDDRCREQLLPIGDLPLPEQELVIELKGSLLSKREQAEIIVDWVADNYIYSLDPKNTGLYDRARQAGGIKELFVALSTHRKVKCDGAATVAIAMLRALDIPARLAVGYLGEKSQVTTQDAHGWVEVLAEDELIFLDPTPSEMDEVTQRMFKSNWSGFIERLRPMKGRDRVNEHNQRINTMLEGLLKKVGIPESLRSQFNNDYATFLNESNFGLERRVEEITWKQSTREERKKLEAQSINEERVLESIQKKYQRNDREPWQNTVSALQRELVEAGYEPAKNIGLYTLGVNSYHVIEPLSLGFIYSNFRNLNFLGTQQELQAFLPDDIFDPYDLLNATGLPEIAAHLPSRFLNTMIEKVIPFHAALPDESSLENYLTINRDALIQEMMRMYHGEIFDMVFTRLLKRKLEKKRQELFFRSEAAFLKLQPAFEESLMPEVIFQLIREWHVETHK